MVDEKWLHRITGDYICLYAADIDYHPIPPATRMLRIDVAEDLPLQPGEGGASGAAPLSYSVPGNAPPSSRMFCPVM